MRDANDDRMREKKQEKWSQGKESWENKEHKWAAEGQVGLVWFKQVISKCLVEC